MIALSLDTAKNAAIVVAVVFIALSIVSAIVVKKIVTKLILVVLMAGLALGAYTQRKSLEDCADRVQTQIDAGQNAEKTTCNFFGTDVDIPVP